MTVWRSFLIGFLLTDIIHTTGACLGGWSSFIVSGVGRFWALLFAGTGLLLLPFLMAGKRRASFLSGWYLLCHAGILIWGVGVRRPLLWLSLASPLRLLVLLGIGVTCVMGVIVILKAAAHKGRQEDKSA